MKLGFWLIFGIGTVLTASGSPISVLVDSMEMLKELKIRIEHEEFDGFAEDDRIISVKMTWKSIPKDKDFPPRFDLILFRPTEPGKPSERRMWVITKPNAEGLCVSEFAVSKSEVEYAQLVFHNGQHEVHGFSLSDYLAGFPDPGLDPFSRKPHKGAEQADDAN